MHKLNKKINSNDQETSLSLSVDGSTMYFSSNRPGGLGGMDIYKSVKKKGEWCKPENLGNTINTDYNEEAPCILSNYNILLFSSEGHNNMGGMDIFCSQLKDDGTWSEPKNLGSPINTTDDDLFLWYVEEGDILYFSKFDATGYGKHDIFKLETNIEKITSESAMAENVTYNEALIDNASESSLIVCGDENPHDDIPYYTIQIMALKKPVSTGYFNNLDSVQVYKCNDLINRYTYGKFYGFTEAKKHLEKVHSLGYSDAFIRELNSILNYDESSFEEKR